jgi:PPM family protein phosphatase
MPTRFALPDLQFAFASDAGRVRAHNEDAVAVSPEFGLAIVADGMGGYNAGEVASGIATSLLKEAIEQRFRRDPKLFSLPAQRMRKLLLEDIRHASASIYAAACLEPACQGMGTTLVMLLLRQHDLIVAHVGDSRAYCLRGQRLIPLTRDHSLLQQQIDAGLMTREVARQSKQKNLLTRGMGVHADVEPEVHSHAVRPGDLLLLCSDGLTDELPDEAIRSLLLEGRHDIARACEDLIAGANAQGGADNISVVLVQVAGKLRVRKPRGFKHAMGRILSFLQGSDENRLRR